MNSIINSDGRIVRLEFTPLREGEPLEVEFSVADAAALYVSLGDALWSIDDSLVAVDVPSAQLRDELGIF